uniref:Laminin G domain-containing protein n=1 Tax=Panagrellus redivivus TaxID=6233 RepID=A0A7E4UR16_PANRE
MYLFKPSVLLLLLFCVNVFSKDPSKNKNSPECSDKVTQTNGKVKFELVGTGQTCQIYSLAVASEGFLLTFQTSLTTDRDLGIIWFIFAANYSIPVGLQIRRKILLIRDTNSNVLLSSTQSITSLFVSSNGVVINLNTTTNLKFPKLRDLHTTANYSIFEFGLKFTNLVQPMYIQIDGHLIKNDTYVSPLADVENSKSSPSSQTSPIPVAKEKSELELSEKATTDPPSQSSKGKTYLIIGLVIVIAVVVFVISIGLFFCVRRRLKATRKPRPTSTPRPESAQSSRQSGLTEIAISYEGYDLFIPGHPDERAEYMEADAAKKSKMVAVFLQRRQQLQQSRSTGP